MKVTLRKPHVVGDVIMNAGDTVELDDNRGKYFIDMGDAVAAKADDKITPPPAPTLRQHVNIGTDDLAAVVAAVRKADAKAPGSGGSSASPKNT